MPHLEWQEDDMKYNLAFLPLVGVIIGALEYALIRFALYYELPEVFSIAVISAIPLIVTGGFHVDGFMDTQVCSLELIFHSRILMRFAPNSSGLRS